MAEPASWHALPLPAPLSCRALAGHAASAPLAAPLPMQLPAPLSTAQEQWLQQQWQMMQLQQLQQLQQF